MTTYKGNQSGRAIHATSESGNAWSDTNKITPAAALAAADVVVLAEVPAGVKLTKLRYRAGDFDTGTTLVYDIGYRSKHATPVMTDDLDYFADDATTIRSAVATWTDFVFEEVTFQEPVEIVLIPSVGAAGVSGTPSIYVQLDGVIVGVS